MENNNKQQVSQKIDAKKFIFRKNKVKKLANGDIDVHIKSVKKSGK